MKTKTKILLTLGVMLIAILLFSTNNVKASVFSTKFKAQVNDEIMAVVETGNITKNSLDNLNTINVNLKESECDKTPREIFNQITTELAKQNITIKEIANIEEYNEFYKNVPNEYTIINIDYMVSEIDIYKVHIGITKYIGEESETIIDKEISVKYNNSSEYNENDKKQLEQKLNNLNLPKSEDGYYQVIKYEEVGEGIGEAKSHIFNYDTDIIKEAISDNNITVLRRAGGMGGGTYLPFGVAHNTVEYLIFKNDILYTIQKFCPSIPNGRQITIPSNVDNIEEYAIPKIKSHIKEFCEKYGIGWGEPQTIRLSKVKDNSYKVYATFKGMEEMEMTTDNVYLIIQQEEAPTITKEDKTTGIKIEGNLSGNIILSVNTVTDQTTLNKVTNTLKNIASKYTVYDITLLENNKKVQPDGKVKVYIPIPSGYDASKLIVYRVADNGEKTEYSVKVNGSYATFETEHFSTYVLAEKETTTNKGEKDDTPKTGTIEVIYYVLPIIIVSAVGVIALRKKQTK